ncbi:OFA family oxalate/formate antiporter-like MFS transporter [Sedimentibacter acidaminivorans]|uniref:OFA family oxalate/formate antiporter-like MFS transporter n=1 Tax=Sedimentibacter acidaminivorans TaxID=913099 RepID=A0ABS4GDN7_9FIRM|nr:OFA family MFS transporter [Sedimentibacter acidaminivorans]MBP1925803.1 OFA family oxalate/formate antiporter-like MFS transporter [Sedimentibacter acidaminivorans]
MDFKQKRWKYLAAAMLMALCSGIGYTWSVFQKPLMEDFNWALKTISLTFTIQILVSTLAPVFLGRYQKVLGVKKYLWIGIGIYLTGLVATMFTSSIGYLYIMYGIVVGIGISMLYPSLMAYSTSLFPDKTGMASGMLACAYGGGSIIWAPLAAYFTKQYGVLYVFGILAVIFAVVMIPTSFLIRSVPEHFNPQAEKKSKKNLNVVSVKDYTWKEMLRTGRFYIILTALTLGATSGLMITGHASSMLQEIQKMTAEQAALLIGFISISNALGRLTFGFVSDRLGRYNIMLLLFSVIGCSMVLLTKSEGMVFDGALLAISACYGGFTSMFSPICADNFGIKNLSFNYAFLYVAYGIAGVIGPQLAAWTKTVSGGYNLAFIAVAVMSAVGFGLTFLLKIMASGRYTAIVRSK